jgi:hypothetical protein
VRKTLIIICAVLVVLALAGAGVALWQAAAAQREATELRAQVHTLESRLQDEQERNSVAEEAVAQAQRDAGDAVEKAAAVDKRVSAALRGLRKQIGDLGTPTEKTSAIQECGNKPAGGAWTYGQVDGAGHFNLTARNVSCPEARYLVDHINFESSSLYYPGWSCGYVRQEFEFSDIRCTSGIKVIRWQTGA